MIMLQGLANAFLRHPAQLNQLSEADAEILLHPGVESDFLVLKIDGIAEEIQEKLYNDPYQIGWMGITVTISDLAAVGAQPIGILLALQIPAALLNNQEWVHSFQQGINAACKSYGVYILGGDTNNGDSLTITTAGVATGVKGKTMLRKGISVGDALYSTGQLGLGSAYAYAHYFDPQNPVQFLPEARLKQSRIIREFATACIDTSDGLFAALSILSELNDIGFSLTTPLTQLLHPEAFKIAHAAKLPSWIFLAGPHGEYELIFSISPEKIEAFEAACTTHQLQMHFLGHAQVNKSVDFLSGPLKVSCTPALIANLFQEANGNVAVYLELLMQQHQIWLNQ